MPTHPDSSLDRRAGQRLECREDRAQTLDVLERHLRRVRGEVLEGVLVRRRHVKEEASRDVRLALRRERVQRERLQARPRRQSPDPRPQLREAAEVGRACAHRQLPEARRWHVVVPRKRGVPKVLGVERDEVREEGEDLEDRGGRGALEAERAEAGEVGEDCNEDRRGHT